MTLTYYEVEIIHTGSSDGVEFSMFDEETHTFETAREVTGWLQKRYSPSDNILIKDCHVKRNIMYHADNVPCGYVYEFENADWSHAPVEHWRQKDWVSISKICAEDAFEEVKYEIPETKTM